MESNLYMESSRFQEDYARTSSPNVSVDIVHAKILFCYQRTFRNANLHLVQSVIAQESAYHVIWEIYSKVYSPHCSGVIPQVG